MVVCPHCGMENTAGRRFCGGCGVALVRACAACGAANEPGMRFCGQCGADLDVVDPEPEPGTPRTAERRLVSVLFADLVGFTSLSETRDSEEVRELLSQYFDTCRRLIGLYGGTVEKFIGDAVMAVWGTPVAQEDDAERAVRAGLDLVAAVAELGEKVAAPELRLRAGVATGEAAVTVGAQGEGMVAGDLVNTASRVQSAADPGTVLVVEATKRATDAAVAYEPAGSHELKGKSEAMSLYRALRVTGARGGALKGPGLEPPFVGRERELRLVKELFHATVDDRTSHLITVVGIAGIGKSRLAWEFEKYADGLLDQVWWHRGRCLAYGDGVAYWALAEMVRMRARIAEEDGPEAAIDKLRSLLADAIADDDERAWLEPRLAQLLALGNYEAADRNDLFAAWRLFFERLAEKAPVALIFEDLQWADASLLDFIEHVLDWSRAHPIYVLALARPELAERRPGWGAAGRSSTTLSLEPLSERAMEQLLDGFVPGLPDELRVQILERAEGVPLYAVETVRMLLDRGLLERDGEAYRITGSVEALEVPETLHALVAARLDGLSSEERQVVQDAAVLGKSFTKPGLCALSGLADADADRILNSLIRKEVLSVQADPRSPERGQYSFLQDLLKRVAYETLSKQDRKARHLAAAAHLEQAWPSADSEIVEVVAAHYLDAYRAAPDASDSPEIKAKAGEHLALAGARAASLAASEQAERYYLQASDLADDAVTRAELLERAGTAAQTGGRYEAAIADYEQAIELYNSAGETHRAARVTGYLGWTIWFAGDLALGVERLEQALAVLADDEPDADVAGLIEFCGRARFFSGDLNTALVRVDRALEIAEALFVPGVLVDALNTKHLVLHSVGREEEALALLERAIAIAREYADESDLNRALYNLSYQMVTRDRFVDAKRIDLEVLDLARRRGDRVQEQLALGHIAATRFLLGDWDETLEALDEMGPGAPRATMDRLYNLSRIDINRGDVGAARRELEAGSILGESAELQARGIYLLVESVVLRAEGNPAAALASATEALGMGDAISHRHPFVKWAMVEGIESAFDLGDLDRVADLLGEYDRMRPVDRTPMLEAFRARFEARLAAREGDALDADEGFRRSAQGFRELGMPFPLAVTLFERGEWLARAGRADESLPLLEEARAMFERLRAQPWLDRVDAVGREMPSGVAGVNL